MSDIKVFKVNNIEEFLAAIDNLIVGDNTIKAADKNTDFRNKCKDINFVEDLISYDIEDINYLRNHNTDNETKIQVYNKILHNFRVIKSEMIAQISIDNIELYKNYITTLKVVIDNYQNYFNKTEGKLQEVENIINEYKHSTNKLTIKDICKTTGLTEEELKNIISK